MKLGISQDIYLLLTDSIESIRRIARAGFDTVDFNIPYLCLPDSPLASKWWQSWIEDAAAAARDAGVIFSQVHAPMFFGIERSEYDDFYDEMTDKAFHAARAMGVEWVVFHPRFAREGITAENIDATREFNVAWLSGMRDKAALFGLTIAVENLGPTLNFYQEPIVPYCSKAEELMDLVQALGIADEVGICLDTGHGFVAGYQPEVLVHAFGSRIKVLHVHDNDGRKDQHMAPFTGGIDWMGFMQALKTSGFDGALSLEIHNFVQRMPEELIDDAVKLACRIGRYLMTM